MIYKAKTNRCSIMKDSHAERIEEMAKKTEFELNEKGFKKKLPSVWQIEPTKFVVYKKDESERLLRIEDVNDIIDKIKTIDPELDEIIEEWNKISTYGVEKRINELKQKTIEEKNPKLKSDLVNKIIETEKLLYSRERKLKELEFLFGETDEKRLEEVYLIMHGYSEYKKINLGAFVFEIPLKFYREEMKRREYDLSIDFFEDMRNAYRLLKNIKMYFEKDPDILEEEIIAEAEGFEPILENNEPRELLGKVWINENTTEKELCRIDIHPINLSIAQFARGLKKAYPAVPIQLIKSIDEDDNEMKSIRFTAPAPAEKEFIGFYNAKKNPHLSMVANPDLLEDVFARLSEYIFPKNGGD